MKYNAVLSVEFSSENETQLIDIEKARNYLKVTNANEDEVITALIPAARIVVENYINYSLQLRTVEAVLNVGLCDIWLPYGAAKNVIEIKDKEGKELEYTLHGGVLSVESTDCIKVKYEAGYTSEILPANLRNAWLQQLSYMYEHRGDANDNEISPNLKTTLNQIRRLCD